EPRMATVKTKAATFILRSRTVRSTRSCRISSSTTASTTREPLNKSRSNQARHSGFRRDDEQEAAWSEYPWQAAGLESAGLQIRLRGPYSRRFLAHRTTMRLRI